MGDCPGLSGLESDSLRGGDVHYVGAQPFTVQPLSVFALFVHHLPAFPLVCAGIVIHCHVPVEESGGDFYSDAGDYRDDIFLSA